MSMVVHRAPDDRIGRRVENKLAHNELRCDFAPNNANYR
jgi:hypothetical protein